MRVGYKLRREIRDLFPPACTPAERVVALEIADTAKEATRISLIKNADLCTRSGLTADGVRRALRRLSERGLEFRISHGKGADGREVYTKPGTEIEYRVPSEAEFGAVTWIMNGKTPVLPSPGDNPVDRPP